MCMWGLWVHPYDQGDHWQADSTQVYAWIQVIQMPVMGFRHLLAQGVLSVGAVEYREPAGHEQTEPLLSPTGVEPL